MSTFTKNALERLLAPMAPKQFSICVAGFVLFSLGCVGIVNWTINPFGQYRPKWLAPTVQITRKEKVDLFEALTFVPDGLVLGSSRAQKFEPDYLQRKTSQTFYNFAVNNGRPEDFLAILRYYQLRLHRFPKTLVIGVDIASLNDEVPNDAMLSSEPRLYNLARDTISWSDEFGRFSQLFSLRQLGASGRSIRNGFLASSAPKVERSFRADGVVQYHSREKQMEAGNYDFESAFEFNRREFLTLFSKLIEPSQRRLGYLRETLRLSRENDCQVYLFDTVFHPRLRESLHGTPSFSKLEARCLQAVQSMAVEYGAHFINLGSIESFGGSPDDFVDGIHPLEPNTRRMIDKLFSRFGDASYAIQ